MKNILSKATNRIYRYGSGFMSYIKNVWLNVICSSPVVPIPLRRLLLRLCGHKVSTVYSNCFFGEGPGHLYVGRGSFCNHCCFFDLGNDITIGDNCCVAMNVSIINGTHQTGNHDKRGGGRVYTPYTNQRRLLDMCQRNYYPRRNHRRRLHNSSRGSGHGRL